MISYLFLSYSFIFFSCSNLTFSCGIQTFSCANLVDPFFIKKLEYFPMRKNLLPYFFSLKPYRRYQCKLADRRNGWTLYWTRMCVKHCRSALTESRIRRYALICTCFVHIALAFCSRKTAVVPHAEFALICEIFLSSFKEALTTVTKRICSSQQIFLTQL